MTYVQVIDFIKQKIEHENRVDPDKSQPDHVAKLHVRLESHKK